MIFLLLLPILFLFVGFIYLVFGKFIKIEKKKQKLIEWGYTFICGSIFPFLIILMLVL